MLPWNALSKTRHPLFPLSLAVIFLFLGISLRAQDVNTLLQQARDLEKNHQEVQALAVYQKILKTDAHQLEALIRSSELCSLVGNRFNKKEQKLTYFKAAQTYAQRALQVQPRSAEAHFVMAVAMGRLALLESGKAKVQAVNDIKRYAETSISLDPSNFKSYHVLGKWHYEVSRLNSFERTAIKMFFGGMPASSFDLSIQYYSKSLQLAPDFNLNYLELAKAYHANHQNDKAIPLLQKLATLPLSMSDDERIRAEGKKLLKEIQ